MAEINEIQVQYKGQIYSIPVEKDNSLKLENVKTIDVNAVGVAHYNLGDAFRKKVLSDPKGFLRTREQWLKNVRLVVKDPDTKKPIVVDE
uniref:Uncharacterized protein n=1 Tax=Acrobeloides nanus TaxID=290746 RepID=A0A914E1G7_9BILA